MKDSLQNNNITVESFQTQLIISEITVTVITLVGFYLVFNYFNKKNKAFREKQNQKG